MGRQNRKDADFFPFYTKQGRTLTILKRKHGFKGLGFFTQLCIVLSNTPDHHIKIKDHDDWWMFLDLMDTNEEEFVKNALDLVVRTGKVDKELYEMKIIYCQDLVDSLEALYKKRTSKIVTRQSLMLKYRSEVFSGAEMGVSGAEKIVSDVNPVRKWGFPVRLLHKEEKRREEKRREESKPSFHDEDIPMRLSRKLFRLVKNNYPQSKEPNFQKWAYEIDKMIRLDKRDPKDIDRIIDWSQQDDFWFRNCRSAETLRKKFEKMDLQTVNKKIKKVNQFEYHQDMEF